MSYDPKIIANAFIKIAQEQSKNLTNMQVQKLVYFAHGWYLAFTSRPLISEPVKAWTFGPVIPSVYESLRHYKASPINLPIQSYESSNLNDHPAVEQFLRSVFHKYGSLGGIQMSYLTHRPGTPWQQTWDANAFGVINDDIIREHFLQLGATSK